MSNGSSLSQIVTPLLTRYFSPVSKPEVPHCSVETAVSSLVFVLVYVHISRKYNNISHFSVCMFVFAECKVVGLR